MNPARRHPVVAISVVAISVVVAAVVVAASVGVAVAYEHRADATLLAGTTVGGVAVGGMDEASAVRAVRAAVEDPLHRPIRVQADAFTTTTTAWDLGLRVDVAGAVHASLQRAGRGNLLRRLWRRLAGHPSTTVTVTPTWAGSQGGVTSLLDQAAKAVTVPARDAKVDASSGFVSIVSPQDGRRLDLDRSRAAVLDGARAGQPAVNLVTAPVPPSVGAAAVTKVILVRAGENTLSLYENGKVTKQYPVATGQSAYPTPTGTWHVVSKVVNPTWTNPHSAWSAGMPATIGPGPNNPLGTRALALDAPGILIHATSDTSSIGYSASHGCIRMSPADEMDLFGRVDAGTVVAIVSAGPPKPRPSAAAPAPATPDQSATVNY
ncbi:MAG: L,D-transpeptidase family protein [Acidimicrobiales bacterium]